MMYSSGPSTLPCGTLNSIADVSDCSLTAHDLLCASTEKRPDSVESNVLNDVNCDLKTLKQDQVVDAVERRRHAKQSEYSVTL